VVYGLFLSRKRFRGLKGVVCGLSVSKKEKLQNKIGLMPTPLDRFAWLHPLSILVDIFFEG